MTKTLVHIDMVSVTEDDAVKFMIHHLSLAASYFEAVPINTGPIKTAIRHTLPDMAAEAAIDWLNRLDAQYKAFD